MNYPFDFITDAVFLKDNIFAADTILVMGGSVSGLGNRAAELFHSGFGKQIVVSGGKNKKLLGYDSEAEYLSDIIKRGGVSRELIHMEKFASNTLENAKLSYELMLRDNIPHKKVIIISKAFHSRRALFTCQSVFPPSTDFGIATVEDAQKINENNWFSDQSKIDIVMGEIVKLGSYFNQSIADMHGSFKEKQR